MMQRVIEHVIANAKKLSGMRVNPPMAALAMAIALAHTAAALWLRVDEMIGSKLAAQVLDYSLTLTVCLCLGAAIRSKDGGQ